MNRPLIQYEASPNLIVSDNLHFLILFSAS